MFSSSSAGFRSIVKRNVRMLQVLECDCRILLVSNLETYIFEVFIGCMCTIHISFKFQTLFNNESFFHIWIICWNYNTSYKSVSVFQRREDCVNAFEMLYIKKVFLWSPWDQSHSISSACLFAFGQYRHSTCIYEEKERHVSFCVAMEKSSVGFWECKGIWYVFIFQYT